MKKLASLIAVVILLSLTACISTGERPAVKIAYLPVVQSLPLYVALERGYFDDAGIDVELVKFEAPNLVIDALLSDKVDFAVAAAAGITAVANYQKPNALRIFALMGGNESTINDDFIVRKDAGIGSIADLKGKKIGILPGIQFRTLARHIFAVNNMSVDKDVTIVELATGLQVQALASGQVDALITIEPMGTLVRLKGVGEDLIRSPMTRFVSNPWYGGAGVVRLKFAEEHPETTKKVLQVVDRAIKDINKDPDSTKQYLSKYTGMDESLANEMPLAIYKMYTDFNEVDIVGLQKFFDIFTKYGVIDGSVNASGIIFS